VSFAKIVCRYKFDYLLFAFDGSLGPHWNFWLGRVAQTFRPLEITLDTAYNSLGLFLTVLFAAHIHLENNKIDILKLSITNAIIGFSLYFLYPAMGPRYAFPSFPDLPAIVPLGPAALHGIPNAMPSLHMAGALMVFSLSRPWRWFRRISGVYLIVTAMAVFSTGEHYVVDTIVAVPYSLMIIAFASRSHTPGRRYVLAAGSGILTIWLLVLRFGSFNPYAARGLVLTTLALGFLIDRRFAVTLWRPEENTGTAALSSGQVSGMLPVRN